MASGNALDRRDFLKVTSLLTVGVSGTLASRFSARRAWAAVGDVLAKTTTGQVRGAKVGPINVFKGIPYGDTTAGKNRFMPPKKPQAWQGVRDATQYGHSAPQTAGLRPGEQPPVSNTRAGAEGEDCLVLNVYSPDLASSSKLPVMVWLHGGGFTSGSASTPLYNGTNLAQIGNVVNVGINHRLNCFGCTYLAEIAGTDFADSGNVGILDIIASLQWVRENIANFGGDPNNVTIFGESGGGRKVSTLMAMPPAKGLFQRGIIESGAILRLTTPENGTKNALALLKELELRPDQARQLQEVPVDKLLTAYRAASRNFVLPGTGMADSSPVVDGRSLPSHPWDPTGPAVSKDVPLIIGYNRTEETFNYRGREMELGMTEAQLKERLATRLKQNPDEVIEVFKKSHPGDIPFDLFMLICTDHPRGTYSRELAKRKSQQGGAPAYLYRFDWETPVGAPHMRSPHGLELPFVFNNIESAGATTGRGPEAIALSHKLARCWAAFAKNGNPDTPDLPHWPAYTADGRDTMLFNNQSRVEKDPNRADRLIMEKVLKLS